MQTRCLFLMAFSACGPISAPAATHTVSASNSVFTFSPATLTINLGDTVVFALGSIHNAVEVSVATYNANGTTPLPSGFSVPFGGGQVTGTPIGTHYYVCQNHAASGMKGQIVVNPLTRVLPETFGRILTLRIPGSTPVTVRRPDGALRLTLMDAQGRRVWSAVAPADAMELTWDGKTGDRTPATGVLILRITNLDSRGGKAVLIKSLLYSP